MILSRRSKVIYLQQTFSNGICVEHNWCDTRTSCGSLGDSWASCFS